VVSIVSNLTAGLLLILFAQLVPRGAKRLRNADKREGEPAE
jgi:hypothetical protein